MKWTYAASLLHVFKPASSNMSPSLEKRSSSPQVLPAQSAPPGTPSDTITVYLIKVPPSGLSIPPVLGTDEFPETLPDPESLTPDVSLKQTSTSASQVPAAYCAPWATPAPPAPQESIETQKRQGQMDDFECQLRNVLNKSADKEDLFLLSLAPRLRKLSREKRGEVRLEFMTDLHRAEFS